MIEHPLVDRPLRGIRIINAGVNLPPDAAAARLGELGASITKVEPPDGDPTAVLAPGLYDELTAGHEVIRIDLKSPDGGQQGCMSFSGVRIS